jgi:transcriptional regulator with XRE-family HTH domain
MDTSGLQAQIFQHIKNQLPEHLSLVDEVASVLGLSTDSAYRRIRNEKSLSIEELHKICIRFRLSLDQLLSLQSEAILFSGSFIRPASFDFDQYLKSANT